jgi:hypothetical protein
MISNMRTAFVVLLAMVSVATAVDESPDTMPIEIGNEKILLVDEQFLAKSEGVCLHLHPLRKTGEHLVVSEHPWENATLNWFSVLQDGGKYRMWYECYDVAGWPTTDDTSFCYAESDDGIHWNKPELRLYSYQGSKDNNILFRQIGDGNARSRVHGGCVFLDPSAPPEARYKCVSQGLFQGIGERPYYVAGMTSADGLNWTRLPQPICPIFADSQYSGFWDRSLQKYVLFGRVGGRGRALGRSISDRFGQFPPLSLVLQADEHHPSNSDLYNPACIPYPGLSGLYLMCPSLFQHKPDSLDIHLAVSRDGEHWTWPERRMPLIPLGNPGEFDSGSLYMANGCLEVGDELWFYYSGSRLKHEEGNIEKLAVPSNRRIFSRAIAKRDRLVSVNADAGHGTMETPIIRFSGERLIVNATARSGGNVRVGLLNAAGQSIPGRGIEDCVAMTTDNRTWTVSWADGDKVSKWSEMPVRLRVELHDAEVYGFQFTGP